MSFMPVVPPLTTGSLLPLLPGHHVGGQVGVPEGGGGASSLLQPAREQAWGWNASSWNVGRTGEPVANADLARAT